ncbi:hypothetical protein Cabys_1358 [Caldithrix abyssi DSM 13497]|uniref:Uncharacterized protein n=1 Tax=Caldithrix abyssi DSM 13497 TaxID=880073 RepID=A0A1J1C5Z0_CALAY|nr:hypothetical protein Cabys_1358 [Caldithrix abyssi DSM 13497]
MKVSLFIQPGKLLTESEQESFPGRNDLALKLVIVQKSISPLPP